MATQKPGGRITGHIALTFVGITALQEGDYVHVSGPYECSLADGSLPVIGEVSVRNVKRTHTSTTDSFPVGNPGGDVTVEAHCFNVHTRLSGGAITPGHYVAVDGTSALVDGGTVRTDATVGIALTGATAVGQLVDVAAI